MKCYYFLGLVLLSLTSSIAQVGIGTTDPDPSAILEIESTSGGVLIPRMTTTQRNAISTTIESKGLLVFDTTENAFYFYDGVNWKEQGAENNSNDYTGWGDYVDGFYTDVMPFELESADGVVTLPNSATTIRDSQKPLDITTFYDSTSQTITGRNGDGLNIVIEFKVKPTQNQTTKITVAIDIGTPVGEIYKRDFITSKGVNVEHFYLSSFTGYTLGTWEANGGTVKISTDADIEVYDIRYVLTRTHKAR